MIYLKNAGEIDIEVIKTMGVHVKENDNSIGFFGTGLKYAIAIFLREKIDFKLFIGVNQFEFFTETKTIRGKEFEFCKMSGIDVLDLGFTTELGKNWELWQAYREIHSNTLDENGEISSEKLIPEAGTTLFQIDCEEDCLNTFLDANKEILLYSNGNVEIYLGESDKIYYKGIRAKDLNKNSIYTYNILTDCELTEDRALSYDFQVEREIVNAIGECDNTDVINNIITCSNDTYESGLDTCWDTKEPKQHFQEAVKSNLSSVSNNFHSYHRKYEPKAPLTREEIRDELVSEFKDVCTCNDLEFNYDGKCITITGAAIE